MQSAILTNDGFLFLSLLDGSGEFSDGEMTITITDLRADGIRFRILGDVDACPKLSARVARIRAAMLVNC